MATYASFNDDCGDADDDAYDDVDDDEVMMRWWWSSYLVSL